MKDHLVYLKNSKGITFLVITSLVNDWPKIRDLVCSTQIVTNKVVEKSIQSIEGKYMGRNQRRYKAQRMLQHNEEQGEYG